MIPIDMPSGEMTYSEALQIILDVLNEAIDDLPEIAKGALLHANKWLTEGVDAKEELRTRVGLWESITGREMDQSPEVLKTRLVICALYSGEAVPPDAMDTLEYFSYTAAAALLSVASLARVRNALDSQSPA